MNIEAEYLSKVRTVRMQMTDIFRL